MRRLATLAAGLLALLALSACQKPTIDTAWDMSLGSPTAKVTVIEYASVACPHCGRWNREVFPAFRAKYIDTGRVHYISREFLVGNEDEVSIALAGFLTARCAGKDKYFQVVDAIYHAQDEMQRGGAHDVLLRIAQSAGMTKAQFDACIRDDKKLKALQDRVAIYQKVDNVTGTPTFIINGKHYSSGEMPLADLDRAVAEAEARGKPAS